MFVCVCVCVCVCMCVCTSVNVYAYVTHSYAVDCVFVGVRGLAVFAWL